MKVIAFAGERFVLPAAVQRVATERHATEAELSDAVYRLSGGAFTIVVFHTKRIYAALRAAKRAIPQARVYLLEGGELYEIPEIGVREPRRTLPA